MGKKKLGKGLKQQMKTFEDLIRTSRILLDFNTTEIAMGGAHTSYALDRVADIFQGPPITINDLLDLVTKSRISKTKEDPGYASAQHFFRCFAEAKNYHSHKEKRQKTQQLGLKNAPYSVKELLERSEPHMMLNGQLVKLVERARTKKGTRYQKISEADRPGHLVANTTTGFYVVDINESIIFFSYDEAGEVDVELVALRRVAHSAPFSAEFYRWLRSTVRIACSERCNVRPNHPGHMAQIGLNMGPRHAPLLGWAKSFTVKLDQDIVTDHDLDAIGAVSITWSLFQSVMPEEILHHIDECLSEAGLPRLATRNIEEGHGFQIKLGDESYHFPTAERAPPEAYFTQGYEAWTHTDAAYCTYALSFCVGREPNAESSARTAPQMRTRSKAHTESPPVSAAATYPPSSGGSFVDVGLQVAVCAAEGTMIAFKPEYLHGTSLNEGASNTGISITFSQRVGDGWKDAHGGFSAESGPGAGQGNTAA